MNLRNLLLPAVCVLALIQVLLLAVYGWGRYAHGTAYEEISEVLGPLDPEPYQREGQTPHPLLDLAAYLGVLLEPADEIGLLYDWVDGIPTEELDEYLTLAVREPGTLTDRCPEVRPLLDWALEGTRGGFGIDYVTYGSERPPGYDNLRTVSRLIFLCGWTALREGDLDLAHQDARRLGHFASIVYREPSLWNLIQAMQIEIHQHHLLRELLADRRLEAGQARAMRASLPDADLRSHFFEGLRVEVMNVESELEQDLANLLASNDEEAMGWLEDIAFRSVMDQKAAGAYSKLLAYHDSYDLLYGDLREELEAFEEDQPSLQSLRGGYSLNDWRFVARPKWITHHRRLADMMLGLVAEAKDPTERCEWLRRELDDPSMFLVGEFDGRCLVHYYYGEDFLWPSRIRVFENPTGGWWLPSPTQDLEAAAKIDL